MAFFKKKKASEVKPVTAKKETAKVEGGSVDTTAQTSNSGLPTRPARPKSDAGGSQAQVGGGLDRTLVLVRPHVTEKATDLSTRGVYVFDVHQGANKMQVREAVERLYKVKPIKVNMVVRKEKLMRNPRTGQTQVKQKGSKKALVYLKQGDKIEFV